MFHRIDELDRTNAFQRVAARHHRARVSRRMLVLAVIVLLAVLAARVAAAAPMASPVPVVVPSDCDGELGCGDDAGDDAETATSEATTVDDGDAGDVGNAVMPRIVTRARTSSHPPCACPTAMPLAIADVAAAAVRAAGLAHDPTPSWNTRTRLAGLVPMFSARYGRNLSWKDVDDPTLGYTNMYDLRATWHLDRLLFDQNEIRIAATDVSRRREKRRVEMLAVHTYLAWARLPPASPRAVLLATDLDAMTDGWFSQAFVARRKS